MVAHATSFYIDFNQQSCMRGEIGTKLQTQQNPELKKENKKNDIFVSVSYIKRDFKGNCWINFKIYAYYAMLKSTLHGTKNTLLPWIGFSLNRSLVQFYAFFRSYRNWVTFYSYFRYSSKFLCICPME